MGLLAFFQETCDMHIKKLVEESCDLVIKASMLAHDQKNNPYLVDYALNLLAENFSYDLIKETKYLTLKDKLNDFMTFYVVRNLGRDIDFSSGEDEVMLSEIEKYCSLFIKSNDGTKQLIKSRDAAVNNLTHRAMITSKRNLEKDDNDMIIIPITTLVM